MRAPIEDRSKYEKLAFNADEVSSDSDKEKANRTEERCKKKRRRVKAVLHRKKKGGSHPDANDVDRAEYESDDSIGSASDLKAMNDEDCPHESDKIDETISQSVRTCGSSAYHAECESVATHEEDHRMKRLRRHHRNHQQQLPTIDADPVVGHEYGEKPLLLDDELDPEAKPEQTHGDPFVSLQYNTKPMTLRTNDSSDESESSQVRRNGIWKAEEDVFAMAPFPRSGSSKKSSPSLVNSPQHVTPVASSSPVISGMLVDIEDNSSPRYGYPPENPHGNNDYENVADFVTAVRRPSVDNLVQTATRVELNNAKDLFGSSPFKTNKFTNPFNDSCYKETYSEYPTCPPSDLYLSLQHFQTQQQDTALNSDVESKDLFGSGPFDEFTTLSLNNQQRPTSLPLSQSSVFPDGSAPKTADSLNFGTSLAPMANSVSLADVLEDSMSPLGLLVANDSPKHKKDKSKSDKSKYHLINENHSDTINVLSVKISHKVKGSGQKKTPKGKKNAAVTAGFSNMSFEDFPSDEYEEKQGGTKAAPFEVIREPEKRFGSLKRMSNPFT